MPSHTTGQLSAAARVAAAVVILGVAASLPLVG